MELLLIATGVAAVFFYLHNSGNQPAAPEPTTNQQPNTVAVNTVAPPIQMLSDSGTPAGSQVPQNLPVAPPAVPVPGPVVAHPIIAVAHTNYMRSIGALPRQLQ